MFASAGRRGAELSLGSPASESRHQLGRVGPTSHEGPRADATPGGTLTKGVCGNLRLWRDIRELEREAAALGEWMDDLGDRRRRGTAPGPGAMSPRPTHGL